MTRDDLVHKPALGACRVGYVGCGVAAARMSCQYGDSNICAAEEHWVG